MSLSERTDSEIDRFVEAGDFVSREEAIEEFLRNGISVYRTDEEPASEMDEDMFTSSVDDQQDPARRDDEGPDEPTF